MQFAKSALLAWVSSEPERMDENKVSDLQEGLLSGDVNDPEIHTSHMAGVVPMAMMPWLKMMLFRATRGKAIVLSKDYIYDNPEEAKGKEPLSVYLIIF